MNNRDYALIMILPTICNQIFKYWYNLRLISGTDKHRKIIINFKTNLCETAAAVDDIVMLHSRKQWFMYCIFFITLIIKGTPNESCKVGEVFIVQSDIPKHLVRFLSLL